MKILTLHCDFIRFKPVEKAIKSAEEIEKKEILVNEALVVFMAVEKDDESNPSAITSNTEKEIISIASQVKAKNIVLYPYAHLSPNLSSPEIALKIMKDLEKSLKEKFSVTRAPFGWYKTFEVKCKGHPLSELSREITALEKDTEKKKTQREVISEKIERKHYILDSSGKEYAINLENPKEVEKILNEIGNEDLKTYILFNEIRNVSGKEPPSIKEMQQQELVGYAPEADLGHFKFYPKGTLIFELLKDWAYEIAVKRFNCLQVETPVLYDWSDPEIREQGGSFHERHYTVRSPDDPKKEWVLRFAGDFGLFKIVKAANISYKSLPLRIYEFSKSFRFEQKGELSGLKRLRGFHMPDIHSFTANLETGWEEYKKLYEQYDDLAKGTGIKYAIVFRIVDEFYKKYKKQIIEMLKYSKCPAFIETLSGMKHYWAVKHEFQGIDSVSGATQLSTVQLDVKDAQTYGIVYTDKDNTKKGCVIVHSSVGSIERWLYCILENAFKMKKPQWPYWLSATQARIIPVSEKFTKEAEKIAEKMNSEGIRTDVDDKDNTLSKKISDAEQEWIPYIMVLGEKELQSKKLAVRTRQTGKIENVSEKDFVANLKKEQGDMPWRPLPLPVLISKRPKFA